MSYWDSCALDWRPRRCRSQAVFGSFGASYVSFPRSVHDGNRSRVGSCCVAAIGIESLLFWDKQVSSNALYTSMVFAWSLTETIRFASYSAGQFGLKLAFLQYLRYTLFYVLYPLGAGSEALLMYASIPFVDSSSLCNADRILTCGSLCI
jgi:Protein tyrosine phosphatase-like protein, PTPLA